MLDAIIASYSVAVAKDVLRQSLQGLGKKYFVDLTDIEYVIDSKTEEEIQRCLNVAIKAFVAFLASNIKLKKLSKPQETALVKYFRSLSVSEEIWHLLDPGSEYFDRGKLAQEGYSELSEHFENLEPRLIFDAWEEFLKAFSFASRSTPHFREFLRASYEAGSFRALSNIEDVLEKMGAAINEISSEESVARQFIKEYIEELEIYRNWASSFGSPVAGL